MLRKVNTFKRFYTTNKIKTKGQDLIGPADPVSNIRPIVRYVPENETILQTKLREKRIETQKWNELFWTRHNTAFHKERKEYMAKLLEKDESNIRTTLTADEMSVFYKIFLDKNWRTHVNYNIEWYKQNFTLLWLAFRVNCEKLIKR